MRGVPETPRVLKVEFDFEIEGEPMKIVKDVIYKRRDRVAGEIYRPFEITPPIPQVCRRGGGEFHNSAQRPAPRR